MLAEEIEAALPIGKIMHRAYGKAESCKHVLRECSVIFETVAISASTNDMVTLRAEFILTPAALLSGVFKKENAAVSGLADPGKLGLPVISMVDKPSKRVATKGVRDKNFNLVTFSEEP